MWDSAPLIATKARSLRLFAPHVLSPGIGDVGHLKPFVLVPSGDQASWLFWAVHEPLVSSDWTGGAVSRFKKGPRQPCQPVVTSVQVVDLRHSVLQ